MTDPQGGGGGTFCPSGREFLDLPGPASGVVPKPGGDTGSMGQVVPVYILPVAGILCIAWPDMASENNLKLRGNNRL